MCGIAGYHRLKDGRVERPGVLANALLLGIESRGRDATGILALQDDGTMHLDKVVVPASRYVRSRPLFMSDPRTVLLHTRWATVGARRKKMNAHPQLHSGIAAIHNGTIHNHDELFKTFDLKRHNEVDSEIIPALIGYSGWGQAEHALSLMTGGAAVAVADLGQPGEILLAKLRSYPLVYALSKDMVIWASTEHALNYAWRATYDRPMPKSMEIVHMGIGECLRVNGTAERTTIPGVYGVEKEYDWVTKRTSVTTKPRRRTRSTPRSTPVVLSKNEQAMTKGQLKAAMVRVKTENRNLRDELAERDRQLVIAQDQITELEDELGAELEDDWDPDEIIDIDDELRATFGDGNFEWVK